MPIKNVYGTQKVFSAHAGATSVGNGPQGGLRMLQQSQLVVRPAGHWGGGVQRGWDGMGRKRTKEGEDQACKGLCNLCHRILTSPPQELGSLFSFYMSSCFPFTRFSLLYNKTIFLNNSNIVPRFSGSIFAILMLWIKRIFRYFYQEI